MEGIKRGDIYYIVNNWQEEGSEQKAGRPAIIVSNDKCNQHSSVVEIVYLTTRPKVDLPTHIDIRSAQRDSIALCEQICSVSVDRLGEYIGTCNDYEMQMMDAALLISLGIDIPTNSKALSNKTQNTEKQVVEKPVIKEVPVVQNPEELYTLRAERNTYKQLYENLMERLLAGKEAV